MNLKELNCLSSDADKFEREAASRQRASAEIATQRKSDLPLSGALARLKDTDLSYYPKSAKLKALTDAEALLRDDLLRIAEMDLDAQARGLLAKARANRAAIAAYCDEKAPAVEKAEVAS